MTRKPDDAAMRREASPLALDEQLCFPLYAASNLLTRLYRPVLEPLGLTYPQYLVMLVLWDGAPLSIGTIGEKLHLDSGTLTPLMKRLAASGLVERTRDPADDRRVLISLTEEGRSLRAAATGVPQSVMDALDMPPDELRDLRDGVRVLLHAMVTRGTENRADGSGPRGSA